MNATRSGLATLGLICAAGLSGGCATTPREPTASAAPAAAPTPVMVVDPWARSSSPASGTTMAPSASPAAPTIAEPPESAAPADAAAPPTGARTHKLAKGETLYGLSVKYYGTGTKVNKIIAANPNLKAEKIPVGTTIVIP